MGVSFEDAGVKPWSTSEVSNEKPLFIEGFRSLGGQISVFAKGDIARE